MFLNCGEFVEINSDLLAAYQFNDLSKTFTTVLQITKFYKNSKKIPQRQNWANYGLLADFFLLFNDFQWKNSRSADVVGLRTCRLFLFSSTMVCGGNFQFGPTLSKKGGLCKKG